MDLELEVFMSSVDKFYDYYELIDKHKCSILFIVNKFTDGRFKINLFPEKNYILKIIKSIFY